MAAPLSMDLRQRMVDAVEGGESRNAVAKRFRVGVSTVVRLMQRYRLTGSPAPGQMGGWKRHALADHEARVRAEIVAHPDATLEDLQDALAQDGIQVSHSAVDRFLKALKLTLKKSRSTPLSKAARMSRPRARPGALGSQR
jgi:transposase